MSSQRGLWPFPLPPPRACSYTLGAALWLVRSWYGIRRGSAVPSRCPAGRSDRRAPSNLSSNVRVATSLSLAVLLITPAFYIRRALPFPGWLADLIFVIALCSAAKYRGAYTRFLHDIRTPLFRAAWPFLFVVLPALFVLTWMGFGVHEDGQVFYYGLFPIDFGNLTSIVAVINASPGLPHWPVAGTGILHYHWLFFVFPVWLSSLGDGHTPEAIALVLCNYVAASILFLTISVAADHVLLAIDRPIAASTVVMAAGVVTLGSLVMYPYQALVGVAVRLTHIQSLAIAVRNGLLLSIPNSLAVFGNNTMAAWRWHCWF